MLCIILIAITLSIFLVSNKMKFDAGIGFSIVFGAIVFFVTAIVWPVEYIQTTNRIREFQEIQKTIEIARLDGEQLEHAALITVITKQNAWLANVQYWDNNWLTDWFCSDEIRDLKPIR